MVKNKHIKVENENGKNVLLSAAIIVEYLKDYTSDWGNLASAAKITKVEEKGRRGIIVSSLITFNDRPNPISIDWWILKSSVSDYKVFDIPSMAMACGYFPEGDNFNDDLAKLLNVTPETKNPLLHTGESGVNYNYAILKSLKKKECFF